MHPEPPRGYLSMPQVARLLGWSTQRARRWLVREQAVVRTGRHIYTTRSKLREAFREVFSELFSQDF